MRQRISSATGAVGLLVRACAALLGGAALWPVAATATTGGWSANLAVTIPPGSTLRAGYDVSMPGAHPAATLSVASAAVYVLVKCPDGSQTHLMVGLPAQSYSIPASNNSWFPSGSSGDASTYQGSVAVPSSFCGGRSGSSSTVYFAANFSSTDSSDRVSVRFHVADGSSGGAWSPTNSVTPSASPTPTPAPAGTRAPAPAPTAPAPAPARPRTPAPTSAAPPAATVAPSPSAAPTPAAAPAVSATPEPSSVPEALSWWASAAARRPAAVLVDGADATLTGLVAGAAALTVGGVAWRARRRSR